MGAQSLTRVGCEENVAKISGVWREVLHAGAKVGAEMNENGKAKLSRSNVLFLSSYRFAIFYCDL